MEKTVNEMVTGRLRMIKIGLVNSSYHYAWHVHLISLQTATPGLLGDHRWVEVVGTAGN